MANTTEYLPVATGGGALVDSQAAFAGSGYQVNGEQVGIAQPAHANKMWRQSSMVAAALTQAVADITTTNIADDGVLATLVALIKKAIRNGSGVPVPVVFSATPVFDASLGNVFEITLTGNVTSSTLINTSPGQSLTFIWNQDGTGGRTVVPPANLPMDPIDITTASSTAVQTFVVGAARILRDGLMIAGQ